MALAVVLFVLGLVGGLYFPYRFEQLFGTKTQKNLPAQAEQAPTAPAP
jgi:hypothetical protein